MFKHQRYRTACIIGFVVGGLGLAGLAGLGQVALSNALLDSVGQADTGQAASDLRVRQNHVINWVQGFHQRLGTPVPAGEGIRFVFDILRARGYTDKEIYVCATIVAVDRCLYEGHHPSDALVARIKGWEGPYFPLPD